MGYWQLFGCMVQRTQELLGQQILVTIFLYFNLKKPNNFCKKCCHIWFPFREYLLEKLRIKTKFQTNVLPFEKCVTETRTNINKGCNLQNPYLLTVLLSIPFNKLPWLLELSGTFPVPVRREVELRAPSPPFRAFPDRIFPSTMSLRSPGTSCRPSRDRTRFDRTSMMVSVYPISCRYLQLKIWISEIR